MESRRQFAHEPRILPYVMSVVVPAHNEAQVLGRLLTGLLEADTGSGELEILVVANGCTDATAEVAAAFGPAVRVLETPDANKYRAMRLADAETEIFPRLYVDADVEITGRDALAIGAALTDGPILAAAPERRLPTKGCPWTVRWYYQVWTQLPVIRESLFGRGVIGVSAEGYKRLADLPELMGDDLAAALSFKPDERMIVSGAYAVVHPPRTCADLIRRRVRSVTVTTQAGQRAELAAAGAETRTSRADLLAVLRAAPVSMAPKVAWFLGITLVARRRSGRMIKAGDYTTWLRDESSRAAAVQAVPAVPAEQSAP
jgi:Glycosyl transferase family 2